MEVQHDPDHCGQGRWEEHCAHVEGEQSCASRLIHRSVLDEMVKHACQVVPGFSRQLPRQ